MSENHVYTLERGTAPLLISLPHDGIWLPDELAARLHPRARRVPDTDWHMSRLYAPLARALGASVLTPRASRYLVDLNRPSDGRALYPGRNETGLAPTIGFDGEALYLDPNDIPGAEETAERVRHWWQPYHRALADELTRLKAVHGRVVLWEGHSIRRRVPLLFDGPLPSFNLGTAAGASCGERLRQRLGAVLAAQDRYDHVVDGRFKGGYITRAYGRPQAGIEAVQLELAQDCYMDEASFAYHAERAAAVQPLIGALLETCVDLPQKTA